MKPWQILAAVLGMVLLAGLLRLAAIWLGV
jgi:hypothetical protein